MLPFGGMRMSTVDYQPVRNGKPYNVIPWYLFDGTAISLV